MNIHVCGLVYACCKQEYGCMHDVCMDGWMFNMQVHIHIHFTNICMYSYVCECVHHAKTYKALGTTPPPSRLRATPARRPQRNPKAVEAQHMMQTRRPSPTSGPGTTRKRPRRNPPSCNPGGLNQPSASAQPVGGFGATPHNKRVNQWRLLYSSTGRNKATRIA